MCQTNQAVNSAFQSQEKPIPLNENEKSRGDREIHDEDERFAAGNNGKEQQQNK